MDDSSDHAVREEGFSGDPPPDGYKGIVNRGPAVVFIWRIAENWPVVFVSDNVGHWGYKAQDMLAGRITGNDYVHREDLPRVEEEVQGYLANDAPEYSQQYRILTAGGEIRWVEDRNIVIRDANGAPRYIQSIVLDITDRKRLERAIAQTSLQERERIGQDLHDSLAQDLAALRFLSEALAERVSGAVPEFIPLANEIRSAADRAYTDVQKLARGLCPVELEDRELKSALGALSQAVSLASKITCTFQTDGWCSACNDKLVASCIYRIAAEAVTNAERHAQASQIDITLWQEGHQCVLQVQDNGIGFELDSASPKGMGILNMSYRASLIGGSLTVRRVERGGTLVRCSFAPV